MKIMLRILGPRYGTVVFTEYVRGIERIRVRRYHRRTGTFCRRNYTTALCPVCGTRVTPAGITTDDRLIASCGDAFSASKWTT